MKKRPPQMLCMSRPHWLRQLLTVVAWVCLGTQLSALTHFLIVEHVRCAEHGDLIHADEQHNGGVEEGSAQLGAPTSTERFTPAGEGDGHDHDHCLVSSERRESSVLAPTLSIPTSTGVHTAILSDSLTELVLFARVYAFAPKTSPPTGRSSTTQMAL